MHEINFVVVLELLGLQHIVNFELAGWRDPVVRRREVHALDKSEG